MSHGTQNPRDLWVAVVVRAILDATGTPVGIRSPGDVRYAQLSAQSWLEDGGADFREVCEMAGIDPEALRRIACSGQLGALVKRHRDSFNGWNVNDGKKF